MEHCLAGQGIDEVEIAFVTTGDEVQKYTVYLLQDVLLSHYSESHHVSNNGKPMEVISLNFTTFEKTFTPFDENHKAETPIRTGYDLTRVCKL